jgi:pimeloyl-ACP methyl ester carboxylesterase
MATFVLIPGAGGAAWYWHLVEPVLRQQGHDVIAVDLPGDDASAGLAEYTDLVVDAIGDQTGIVLVAQSFAGFTAPLVCERVRVDLLVMVAAMVPKPGESSEEWLANTGWEQARLSAAARDGRTAAQANDFKDLFFHDVPLEIVAEAAEHERDETGAGSEPWPLAAWPKVPTKFLLCRDDHFFPAEFQRRVVKERLGVIPDEIDGGHCVALSRPKELAERLDGYAAGIANASVTEEMATMLETE